jgi:hypothetical protein
MHTSERPRPLGSLGAVSSNLPISSPYRSTPEAPVTEAERNQLSSRLNAAFEAGSLDENDYRQRLDVLFAAQKLGQLVPVVEGLPPLQTYADPKIVASTGGQPGVVSESRSAAGIALLVGGGVVVLVVLIAILLVILI